MTGCGAASSPDAASFGAPPDIVVVVEDGARLEAAERLAGRLGVPVVEVASDPCPKDAASMRARTPVSETPAPPIALRFDAEGLSLVGGGMELRGDFTRMLPRLKPANLNRELLVRAARLKGFAGTPHAVDATAGLGEDSLLLAASGFEVLMLENDPVVAALLADALSRAADVPELAPVVGRMRLVEGDSVAELARMRAAGEAPDVVYLDPMFPERRKSAAVKKKFQLIHHLERPCPEEEQVALLEAALAVGPRKVVVKRPVKGPHLAGVKPSYTIAGKAVRYDCIVPPRG